MAKREYLGNFELVVMLALIRLDEKAYGVPIAREIKARTGRRVSLGSIYATLERLEANGLVSSKLGEPTPERGGRAKKYFRISGIGLRNVRATQHMLIEAWRGLTELETYAHKANMLSSNRKSTFRTRSIHGC